MFHAKLASCVGMAVSGLAGLAALSKLRLSWVWQSKAT